MKRVINNKLGVSAVVATVLIVMITVAAVGIIWAFIIPMIRDNVGSGNVCKDIDISIVSSEGYTCYKPSNMTLIQVKKGNSNINVSGLKFYLSFLGNSREYSEEVLFSNNEYKTFPLNSSTISQIDKIEVVPIVQVGNQKKECSAVYTDNIVMCSENAISIGSGPGQINMEDLLQEVVGGGGGGGGGGGDGGGDGQENGLDAGVGGDGGICVPDNSCALDTCNDINCTDLCGVNYTGLKLPISSTCASVDEVACGVEVSNNSGQCGGTNCSVTGTKCDSPMQTCISNTCQNIPQYGTLSAPFLISTCEQLQNVNNNLTASYKLVSDIDCSATKTWNYNVSAGFYEGFRTIGTCISASFNGNFDGNYHTISNLFIYKPGNPNNECAGLFAASLSMSNISRVNLVNVNITGRYYVGGLVGYNEKGNIRNCSSHGVVSGIYDVGGLVGRNYAGLVESSYSNVTLIGSLGSPTSTFFGGLVGMNYASGSTKKAYINNSYSMGTIIFNGADNVIGGLTNIWNDAGSYSFINNSYSTVNVSAINGKGFVGGAAGIVGYSYWDVNTSNKTTSLSGLGKTTVQMKTISTFNSWSSSVWNLIEGQYPKLKWQN